MRASAELLAGLKNSAATEEGVCHRSGGCFSTQPHKSKWVWSVFIWYLSCHSSSNWNTAITHMALCRHCYPQSHPLYCWLLTAVPSIFPFLSVPFRSIPFPLSRPSPTASPEWENSKKLLSLLSCCSTWKQILATGMKKVLMVGYLN